MKHIKYMKYNKGKLTRTLLNSVERYELDSVMPIGVLNLVVQNVYLQTRDNRLLVSSFLSEVYHE